MTLSLDHDIAVLRGLADSYSQAAARPEQAERRALWRAHLSLKPTRVPVLVTYGMWNLWCRETFGDDRLECRDPFFREHERNLRMQLFHDTIGDDFILEPWITQRAALVTPAQGLWGVPFGRTGEENTLTGGSWKFDPPLKNWADTAKLVRPRHQIDEDETAAWVEKLQEAVGDILEINVDRGPAYFSFDADISTHLAYLRGLEQMMVDMIEAPQQMHNMLAFMRDGILAVHEQAEVLGDWNLTSQKNQVMCYAEELEPPHANQFGRKRRELWYHVAAQEFTGVSPRMHEEFLLRYQLPIISQFGLVAYGCCEDLTRKIKMLRQVPNLRLIAVAPSADVARCAEQIAADYVFSWRPNPSRMVCNGFEPDQVLKELLQGLEMARGCRAHILLKDVETVEGDLGRLGAWVTAARRAAQNF